MAPPFSKKPNNPDSWWQLAYHEREDIVVQFELEFGKDTIKTGTVLKMKNMRGTYKFRCLAHNVKTDATWLDCIDMRTGEWRSFRVTKIRSVVKPKRSRRKKNV